MDKTCIAKNRGIKKQNSKKWINVIAIIVIMISVVMLIFVKVNDSPSSSLPTGVAKVQLFGIEDGIAFYNVYISDSFKWNNASFSDQSKLAKEVIKYCKEIFENENVKNFEVMGFMNDGNIAFSWYGINEIKLYVDGKYKDSYMMSKLPWAE